MEHATSSVVYGHRLTADVEDGMPRSRVAEHRLWRVYSSADGSDAQADGYKSSVIASTTSWQVCSALAMTVGFALLLVNPVRTEHTANLTAAEINFVRTAYISLVLLSVTCSTLGVFVAAFFLHDAHMVPAALYSQFAHAMPRCWNVSTPLAFSNLGILALSASATPLTYLIYGRTEACIAFAAHVVLVSALEAVHVLRLRMWRTLEGRVGERPGNLAMPSWEPLSRAAKLVAVVRHAFLMGPSQVPVLLAFLGTILDARDVGIAGDEAFERGASWMRRD